MGDAYERLSEHDQEQYRLLRSSGQHKKYTSFLAAAEAMYESGKGSPEQFNGALAKAKAVGAQDRDISNIKALAVSGYRKNGRAGMAGSLNHDLLKEYDENVDRYNTDHAAEILADPSKKMEYKGFNAATGSRYTVEELIDKEAANVAPSSVHREELDINPDGSDTAGRKAYKKNLAASKDNTRKAIAAYDSMEGRAKVKAESLIVEAAEAHRSAGRLAPAFTTTITSIDEARKAFEFTNT